MRLRGLVICLLLAGTITSCVQEDKPPVRAKLDFQLFCQPSHGCRGLASGDKNIIKSGVDNQQGLFISCSTGEKKSEFGFYVESDNFTIDVENHSSSKDSTCLVRVVQGKNSYEKACSVSTKGTANCDEEVFDGSLPCKISVKRDDSTISGTLCCRNIPLEGMQAFGDELSLISATDISKPANFEFKYCE